MPEPLVIDNQIKALMFAARSRAEHSVIDHATVKTQTAETRKVDPLYIPFGYLASYTHEEVIPGVIFRHLSVSVSGGEPGAAPHPDIVRGIMQEFRFINDTDEVEGWMVRLPDGRYEINVMEPICGDWAQAMASQMTQTGALPDSMRSIG